MSKSAADSSLLGQVVSPLSLNKTCTSQNPLTSRSRASLMPIHIHREHLTSLTLTLTLSLSSGDPLQSKPHSDFGYPLRIFTVALCILQFIQSVHQQMHIYSFNDLKLTLRHLKRSYMFRSYDHPQGAYIVPC